MDELMRQFDEMAEERKINLFRRPDTYNPQSDKRTQITTDAEEFINPLDVYSLLDILPADVLVSQLYSQNIVTARILQQLKVLDKNLPTNASEASKFKRYKQFAEELYNQTEDVSDIDRDVFWKRFTTRCYPYITRLPKFIAKQIPDQPEPKSESEKRKAQIKTRAIQNRLWKFVFLILINMPFVLRIYTNNLERTYRPKLDTSILLSCNELVNRTYEYEFSAYTSESLPYVDLFMGQTYSLRVQFTSMLRSIERGLRTGKITIPPGGTTSFIAGKGTSVISASGRTILEADLIIYITRGTGIDADETNTSELKEIVIRFKPFNMDDSFLDDLFPPYSSLQLQKFPVADLLALSTGAVNVTVRKKTQNLPDRIIAEFQFAETRTIGDLSDYIQKIDSSSWRLDFRDTDTGISYGRVYLSKVARGSVAANFLKENRKTTLRQLGFSKNLTVETQINPS